MVERTLGLLKEKMIAMLEDLKEGHSGKLWVEAMSMATDMTDICATSANKNNISPHEMWNGKVFSTDKIQSFETMGYTRTARMGHKL